MGILHAKSSFNSQFRGLSPAPAPAPTSNAAKPWASHQFTPPWGRPKRRIRWMALSPNPRLAHKISSNSLFTSQNVQCTPPTRPPIYQTAPLLSPRPARSLSRGAPQKFPRLSSLLHHHPLTRNLRRRLDADVNCHIRLAVPSLAAAFLFLRI